MTCGSPFASSNIINSLTVTSCLATASSFKSEDERHKIYTNESVDNSTHVLILGDSYLDSFILDDLAESFSETWLIWGDYFPQLKEILSIYNPDIIIFECAERCDRSNAVMECAETLE